MSSPKPDTAASRRPRARDIVLSVVPSLILVAVALNQIYLTHAADLTPWKGGGFGMFSTTDGRDSRYLRVYLGAAGRLRELHVPRSLEDVALKAMLLPTRSRLAGLAEDLAERERSKGHAVETVGLEVWRIRYDQTLRPSDEPICSYRFDVD